MAASIPWQTLSEAYGFIGNSLLKPMTQTPSVGLDPAFWATFPRFDAPAARNGIEICLGYAQSVAQADRAEAIQRVAVEYTQLFVGPPSPAAPPWETMNRSSGAAVGFGQATFDMRALLRDAGLELRNENHQYEDHMGIELLYLSELCRRKASSVSFDNAIAVASFIEEHPLSWVEALRGRVAEAFPDGYFVGLLLLAQGILESHVALLER